MAVRQTSSRHRTIGSFHKAIRFITLSVYQLITMPEGSYIEGADTTLLYKKTLNTLAPVSNIWRFFTEMETCRYQAKLVFER